jgi:hypothetical protein
MDCAAVKPRMEALVNGSLPQSERSLAEQHISVCEGCRLELELVRAIGSQEKAPAVGKDDWTLDRIFGAEKNAGGGSPAEPSSTESAKPGPWEAKDSEASGASSSGEDAAESLFGPAAPVSSPPSPGAESVAAEPVAEPPRKWGKRAEAPAEGASWDFEPADAKSNVKPPEQSLFFATEALTRRKDQDSKKGSSLRVILWSAGGLVGAALLAFSSYFVLHLNAPPPGDSTPAPQAPAAGAPDATTPDATPAPGPGAVQPPANSAPTQETAPPPDNSAQATPAAPPRVSASSIAPQALPLGARATEPAPVTRKPAPATTRPKPITTAPVEHHTAPAPSSAAPRTAPSTETPRPTVTSPEPTTSSDDASPEPAVGSTTENGHAWSDGSEDVVPTPKPQHAATRGSSMWQSQAPKPAEPEPAAAGPDSSSPIQRLHLATVAAQEHGDLDALRRLRATWKTFMVKIVGPDRSRAKREYADCLWAIQDLTGRRADQKDTLAAYREYLLGAPAGGADSRSVSRLRQLEDALSEQR